MSSGEVVHRTRKMIRRQCEKKHQPRGLHQEDSQQELRRSKKIQKQKKAKAFESGRFKS